METMTSRQIVAANLRRLRESRGLSQEKAAELVEPYLGTKWKARKVAFSALERTEEPAPFTVDVLVALAAAFEVSPLYFLTPPERATLVKAAEKSQALGVGEFMDLLFSSGWSLIDERVQELPEQHRGDVLRAQTELLDEYTRLSLGDLKDIEEKLEGISLWAGDLRLRFGDARGRVRARIAEERKRLLDQQTKERS